MSGSWPDHGAGSKVVASSRHEDSASRDFYSHKFEPEFSIRRYRAPEHSSKGLTRMRVPMIKVSAGAGGKLIIINSGRQLESGLSGRGFTRTLPTSLLHHLVDEITDFGCATCAEVYVYHDQRRRLCKNRVLLQGLWT